MNITKLKTITWIFEQHDGSPLKVLFHIVILEPVLSRHRAPFEVITRWVDCFAVFPDVGYQVFMTMLGKLCLHGRAVVKGARRIYLKRGKDNLLKVLKMCRLRYSFSK